MKGKLESEFKKYEIRKIWRGRLGLSPMEIDILIGAYYVFEGNATEAQRQLGYDPKTFIKYWKENNLEKRSKNHLSQQEIDKIIGIYNEVKGNACEAARQTHRDKDTVIKYWQRKGLVAMGEFLSAPSKPQIKNIISAYFSFGGNQRKASKETGFSVKTVAKHWKEAGLNTQNYRGYDNSFEYLKDHPKLHGLTITEFSIVDSGLYRRLSREGNLERAIEEKYLRRIIRKPRKSLQ